MGSTIRDSRGVAYNIGIKGEVVNSTRDLDFRVLSCCQNKEYSWIFSSQGVLIFNKDNQYWVEDASIDACYGESIPEYAEPFVLDGLDSYFAIYIKENNSVVTKINKVSGEFKQFYYPLKSYGGWLDKEVLYLNGMVPRKRVDDGKYYSFSYGINRIVKISKDGDLFKSREVEGGVLSKILRKNHLEVLIGNQSLEGSELIVGLEPAYGQDEAYLMTTPNRGDFKAFSLLSFSNNSTKLIKKYTESVYATMTRSDDAIIGFYFQERSGLPTLSSLKRFLVEIESDHIIHDDLEVDIADLSKELMISYLRIWRVRDKYLGIIETKEKMDIRHVYKISSTDTETWESELLYREQFGKELLN
jgi:hypothetical protein